MDQITSTLIFSLLSFLLALIALAYIWWMSANLQGRDDIASKKINRHVMNPIMSPQPWNEWETVGTFNPAALQDDTGKVHLVYRAIGADGVSRFGYASSKDGLTIDERLTYPIFAMQKPRENIPAHTKGYDPVIYPSGGSWGGAEDPRLVRIGEKIYMTFNAFDGWDFIRIALTSINAEDFYQKRWKWSRPVFISPKSQINKNWLLFPEKVNGKFAILHSIVPKVMIEYVDTLGPMTREISSPRKAGPQPGRKDFWDNMIRGGGPPPIKTPQGWLVLYHAMDKREPHIGYKLGALLLDLNNPTKIIARSPSPILTPTEWYENDWKPGVVYACGATVKDDMLYVYYGGGDKHVCVAHTPLRELLDWLLTNGKE